MKAKTGLECQYPEVGETALWQLLKKKMLKENLSFGFLEAVGAVCIEGITLSKDINRFFPTFTLHDETHIVNVCNWMTRLLGEQRNRLSSHEAALLVMAACCHDIGMSVSVDQEEALSANPESLEWKRYFENHYSDDEEFHKTGIITKQMLRSYVRLNHHKLAEEKLNGIEWPDILFANQISCKMLITLCRSHGQGLDSLNCPKGMPYDLRLCAVLLRIADILDFDSSRAPGSLFRQLGLNHPKDFETSVSQTEWMKNRAGVFGEIKDGVIPFIASFTSLQLEYEVRAYLDWVRQELISSGDYLSNFKGRWQDLKLPREISTDSIERDGYQFGKFCMTLDQDQVLTLFTGENLYGDPSVFVRELLQNAIDAVHLRSVLEGRFQEEDGKITIRSWTDPEDNNWFRIEDNGVGMDEDIITGFFLKVGRSYYTSEAFQAEKRHYAPETDYLPISRFGIGILSCFMNDPENTLLEVSTKRYSPDSRATAPAIRMNVTGLHGYYYLAREDAQSENSAFFRRMHHPEREDDGYRTEPGTTICVQVNLGKLGNYRSIKEILDKYIHFPRVRVEYFGPEGRTIYPTQQELMSAVHALNPDGRFKPKKYSYPISSEQFAEIKNALPNTVWEELPALALQCIPLDWYSATNNISGAAVCVGITFSCHTSPVFCEGEQLPLMLFCTCENNISTKEIQITFNVDCIFQLEHQKRTKRFKTLLSKYKKNYIIHISHRDLLLKMNPYEAAVFRCLLEHPCFSPDTEVTAYRGILANTSKFSSRNHHFWVCELLLDGEARPDVSLSRNSINGLPLETACELAIIRQAMRIKGFALHFLPVKPLSVLTERTLQELLEKNPRWEEGLQHIEEMYFTFFQPDCFDPDSSHISVSGQLILSSDLKREIKKLGIWDGGDIEGSLFDWILVAAIKRHTDIFKTGPDTSKMPALLFCMRPNPDGPLGYIGRSHLLNYYNSCHRFSRWLIGQQEAMQLGHPTLYDRLITKMILGGSREEVMQAVNDILTQLRGLKGNPYDVSDALFLQNSDFFLNENEPDC